jgi:hypothetical protein
MEVSWCRCEVNIKMDIKETVRETGLNWFGIETREGLMIIISLQVT